MYIVHVHVRVKPERIDDFIKATKNNGRESMSEPGIVRFEVIQRADDLACFVLLEIYRTDKDPATHKQTLHYKIWREEVENMMAEPRQSIKYNYIFPGNVG